ncbi:MAG: RNA polymerase sigma factor RpoH [Thermodesulfobacteriota bacterium]|nr:RNA polymerase sigma factor RpoH [Thermodesulfobacteriota bacterium]
MNLPAVTDSVDIYIAEINRFPLLKVEEEFKLAVRFVKHNDMQAAEKLITSNLRFVVKIAHEYKNYRVKFIDLIQEGNIGLMHAVKKFDPYKGYRLISYAVWWIRAYMQNFVIKSWSLVKIGTTQAQRKLFFKLNQAKKKLQAISQKSPEFKEIAEMLNVKEKEIEEMELRLNNRDVSLNAAIDDEGESTYIDHLVYKGKSQEDALIKKEEMSLVKKNIAGALEKLNEREDYIIRYRTMADDPETLQEIGDRFHLTRERTRQIEKEALKKLRVAIPCLTDEPKLITN